MEEKELKERMAAAAAAASTMLRQWVQREERRTGSSLSSCSQTRLPWMTSSAATAHWCRRQRRQDHLHSGRRIPRYCVTMAALRRPLGSFLLPRLPPMLLLLLLLLPLVLPCRQLFLL